MKKTGSWIFLILLLAGCFETKFNFRTVVHRNGSTEREVQIDGRGANRFLPPSGPQWEVKTFETKGGQVILEDRNYHVHAQGHFNNPNEITSDFRYNVHQLIENITEETKKEFQRELGIKEPFEQEIRATNRVQFERRRKLFTTEYDYTEVFQNRWLIPILLHDLKKEIIRKESVAIKSQPESLPSTSASSLTATISPSLLSPEKVEELAQKKLVEEILPQFQFHSEITLPGRMVHTNATSIGGRAAIWDFRGTDFEKNFSTYTLRAASRSLNISTLIGLGVLVFFIIGWLLFFWQRKVESTSSRRRRK